MKNERLISIITFLLGGVLAGGAGIVRGDWLGGKAAQEVEVRLKEQAKSDLSHVMSDLLTIKESIQEMRAEIRELRQ